MRKYDTRFMYPLFYGTHIFTYNVAVKWDTYNLSST